MRFASILVTVLSVASPVLADPADEVAVSYGLDPELIPLQCRAVVSGTRMGARISLASCIAEEALDKLQLDVSTTSVTAMGRAVDYPMQLLGSVVAVGSPVERVQALRAESDLYRGMISRIRRTTEYLTWHTTGAQLARAKAQHRAVEIAIAPWLQAATAADGMIAQIARAHPEVARDPVAHFAVKRPPPIARR